MNTKNKVILVAVAIVVIVIIFFIVRNNSNIGSNQAGGPQEEPIDVVLDFYSEWLEMSASTSTNPFESEFYASANISDEVRNRINLARTDAANFDPITCQTDIIPENVRARVYPTSLTEADILVESRVGKETLPMMSFVTMTIVDNAWQITNIDCTEGDIAPEVEFNYDREGLLLKSVPPPYEAGQWHLVFEQDGQMGHVTPLFFSATTTCVSAEGVESVCNPDTFTETSRVVVKGGMTEIGAEVERVEFK